MNDIFTAVTFREWVNGFGISILGMFAACLLVQLFPWHPVTNAVAGTVVGIFGTAVLGYAVGYLLAEPPGGPR